MRKTIIITIAIALVVMAGLAIAGEHMMHGSADGCKYCGMDLQKFANSAMMITYDDGAMVETCSIHCAALDMAINMGKTPTKIMVGDYNTGKKINAEKATWVIDNQNPGTMTSRGKWAFKKKSKAHDYIDENCANAGEMVEFEQALEMAYADMYKDTRMIREKRKMMKKKGMKH